MGHEDIPLFTAEAVPEEKPAVVEAPPVIEEKSPVMEQEVSPEQEKVMEQAQEKRGNLFDTVMSGATHVLSEGMDLVPVVGNVKMMAEALKGETLAGDKMSGTQRIIHGVIGAGCLALDVFGGAGEVVQVAGKGIGWATKLSEKLGEKGLVKAADIASKGAMFMAKHPKATEFVEKRVENGIKNVITKARRGDYTTQQPQTA